MNYMFWYLKKYSISIWNSIYFILRSIDIREVVEICIRFSNVNTHFFFQVIDARFD